LFDHACILNDDDCLKSADRCKSAYDRFLTLFLRRDFEALFHCHIHSAYLYYCVRSGITCH